LLLLSSTREFVCVREKVWELVSERVCVWVESESERERERERERKRK